VTRPDDHEVWEELAAGAALHALEPDEQRAFDLHLTDCARCRRALDDNQLIAAQLGALSAGSDEESAPPSWATIRAGILRAAPDETATVATDELAGRRRPRLAAAGGRRLLAAAAAVAVLAGGGVAAWRLTSDTGACAGISDCHVVQLTAGDGARLQVVVRGESVTMHGQDMPVAPAGKTYVLWQMALVGQAVPVASYSGSGANTAHLAIPFRRTAAFAISEDPAGSLPHSPTDVLATAPVT
jgi:hypothetical protein